jgi:hypothetical protein
MPFRVRIPANFQAKLESMRHLLGQVEAEAVFDRLVTNLFDDIIPKLERFSRIGRDFFEPGTAFERRQG